MATEEKFLDDIGDTPALQPAKEPEAKPAPEAPVKAEAEQPERPDPANSPARPDGYVPRQALEEARREAKEHRDRAALLEDRTNKIIERYFSESQREEAPTVDDPGPEPDATAEPYDWIQWRQKQDRFTAHQREVQHTQQTQQQQHVTRLHQAAAQGVEAFKAQAPDYVEARAFVWNQRGPELMELGYTQEQAIAAIERDELQIVQSALRRGQNPAAVLYNIAKHRGYQVKAAEEKPDPAAAEMKRDPETGKFVSPEAEKAARIKTSQERNGSLSQAPGAPIEKMTAKELASLSEDEMWRRFDSVKNSKGKKDFDRRMNFN